MDERGAADQSRRTGTTTALKTAGKGKRVSRRALFAALGTAGAVGLTGAVAAVVTHQPLPNVDIAPTATPTPFSFTAAPTVFADGTVPASVRTQVLSDLAAVAKVPTPTPASTLDTATDLVLTFGKAPSGYIGVPVGTSAATIITNLRVPVENVTAAQAKSLLAGKTTDWKAVGAPSSLPVHVYALADMTLPDGIELAANAKLVGKASDLLTQVANQAGSIALVPVELANWTVRNLGVGGVYPAQGRGDATPATQAAIGPLTLTLAASNTLVARGLKLPALAAALVGALVGTAPVVDMIAVGDVMLGRGVNNQMVTHKDYSFPYRRIHDEMQTADLRVGNLECTVTDLYPVPTDPYTFTFVTSKKAADGLVYAGFDMLTVANNHANGPGKTPFLDMLKTLKAKNIGVCGGGSTPAEAHQPALATAKGLRVAMLGYCQVLPNTGPQSYARDGRWGIAPADDLAQLKQDLKNDIAAARKQADIVIPYFHWGIEYTNTPTSQQQQAAHMAIDAGADMVLGVHPHWVQGIENYKGRLIIYSLGNFVFDQDWSRPTLEGMLLHLYWRGTTLVGARWVATLDVDRCAPRTMSYAEGADDYARMWSATDNIRNGRLG